MKSKKIFLNIIGFLAVAFLSFLIAYSADSILVGVIVALVPGVFVFEYIKDIIEELEK